MNDSYRWRETVRRMLMWPFQELCNNLRTFPQKHPQDSQVIVVAITTPHN